MPHSRRPPDPDASSRVRQPGRNWKIARWLLPLVVIGVGLAIAQILVNSGPRARLAAPAKQPRLVETLRFTPAEGTPVLEAMGTVVAARKSTLYAQVSGPIVSVSRQLIPGGLFQAGEEILRIDEADYRLGLRQQEANVASAQAALQEELGQRVVARREYELLDQKLDSVVQALVLREPQLASARATLESAEVSRDQAQLALERTKVVAPFLGMVTSRNVDLGTRVDPSTALLSLVSIENVWVDVSVPVADLRWITIPTSDAGRGASVELRQTGWDAGTRRTGHVLRLIPELDGDSRMARLLVEVPDPLALKPEHAGLPPVMVNDFLRVRISGRPLEDVVAMERRLLRDGDQVWIMAPDDTLEIRPVEVAFRGRDQVLIKAGISRDDRVITADMDTPVAGTPLRERRDSGAVTHEDQAPPSQRKPGPGAGS
ncbi:efflux RND transporter periplasmic adaptor subunit [Thiocystis violacea]|uniref:efflux RND transporter periplasmic adaptor subunit n=1 Tax=Thiocystis violacea TaxID=13725 RepID=UPI0019058E9C|nr:efflux RND transporter periplasmic adaptor subunit [Thiocystis violacea]MBK1721255.1 hypothetical protein [Thiocystis violacea]